MTREAEEDELRGGIRISCIGWSQHKSGKFGVGVCRGFIAFYSSFLFSLIFRQQNLNTGFASISVKAFYSTTIKFLN